jgi:hypothetical protein
MKVFGLLRKNKGHVASPAETLRVACFPVGRSPSRRVGVRSEFKIRLEKFAQRGNPPSGDAPSPKGRRYANVANAALTPLCLCRETRPPQVVHRTQLFAKFKINDPHK